VRLIERAVAGRKGSMTFGGTGTFELPSFWTGEAVREREDIACNFDSYISGAYKSSGPVFACILARLFVFAEARFQFQRLTNGRPADLFGTPDLALLENPWPNGTTGELLARMEQDGSLAGNFFATVVDDKDGRRIRRLRPDHVTIVTGSRSGGPLALDARVVGYIYHPYGSGSERDSELLTPDRVAHWTPIPDPDAQWRGMSWLTPVIREIQGDLAASDHKLKYFKNGATGGIAVSYDKAVSPDSVARFAELFKQKHAGTDNAYKTFHFGGGADVTTIGADLKQLDFKVTQGAGETRIAAASGVGAVIAQLSEGLQGSSLNAGNFNAAKRRFTDGTMRPLWRSACGALQTLVPPPAGSRRWYDTRDVAFLQEDQKDEAEIQSSHAATIRQLTDAGYDPDAVVTAVTAGDLKSLIGKHTGLYSVQLQRPSSGEGNQ
jgi:phage portal protein BeeE